jgi:hypothetical protein
MSNADTAPAWFAFRPPTYFAPRQLEAHLVGEIRNAALRSRLFELLRTGQTDRLRELLGSAGLDMELQRSLESLHPQLMGGNYLSETEGGELEVARIAIDSTTRDVTAVYARMADGQIELRVVDEYGGDTLTGETTRRTPSPLSLGELVDFFFAAWPLDEVCECNFEDDLEGQLGFFDGQSDFYPRFGAACTWIVRQRFAVRHAASG